MAEITFPKPTPVSEPPAGATKDNPAVPIVRDALGKGWQRFDAGNNEAAAKQRELIARAGRQTGLKTRTRTHKDGTKKVTSVYYLLVTEKDDGKAAAS